MRSGKETNYSKFELSNRAANWLQIVEELNRDDTDIQRPQNDFAAF